MDTSRELGRVRWIAFKSRGERDRWVAPDNGGDGSGKPRGQGQGDGSRELRGWDLVDGFVEPSRGNRGVWVRRIVLKSQGKLRGRGQVVNSRTGTLEHFTNCC